MFKFELGVYVRDQLTGFEGTIDGRAHRLGGFDQYSIKPKVDDAGKMQEGFWLDENHLVEDAGKSLAPVHGAPTFKYKIGEKVKDKLSGFDGVVESQIQWINGCQSYWVDSVKLVDGKPATATFLETQLESKNKVVELENSGKVGGPVKSAGVGLRSS